MTKSKSIASAYQRYATPPALAILGPPAFWPRIFVTYRYTPVANWRRSAPPSSNTWVQRSPPVIGSVARLARSLGLGVCCHGRPASTCNTRHYCDSEDEGRRRWLLHPYVFDIAGACSVTPHCSKRYQALIQPRPQRHYHCCWVCAIVLVPSSITQRNTMPVILAERPYLLAADAGTGVAPVTRRFSASMVRT